MPCQNSNSSCNRLSPSSHFCPCGADSSSGNWNAAIEPSMASGPIGRSPAVGRALRRPSTASSWFRRIKAGRPPSNSDSRKPIASPTQSQGVGSSVPGQSKASCKAE